MSTVDSMFDFSDNISTVLDSIGSITFAPELTDALSNLAVPNEVNHCPADQ